MPIGSYANSQLDANNTVSDLLNLVNLITQDMANIVVSPQQKYTVSNTEPTANVDFGDLWADPDDGKLYMYDGASFVVAIDDVTPYLAKANDLSDLANSEIALDNLGALSKENNLSDLANVDIALTNLGISEIGSFNETFNFPDTDGANGQFLKTDGNGNLVFADVVTEFEIITSGDGSYISANGDTITIDLITDADIANNAGIDASKIGSGDVSTAEFDYLNGVSSSIQTQLNNKQAADATLTALAGLSTGSNKIPYSTGADAFSQLDFLDEDTMSSNSATGVPSQQSVKTYVDDVVAGSSPSGVLLASNNLSDVDSASTARSNINAQVAGTYMNPSTSYNFSVGHTTTPESHGLESGAFSFSATVNQYHSVTNSGLTAISFTVSSTLASSAVLHVTNNASADVPSITADTVTGDQITDTDGREFLIYFTSIAGTKHAHVVAF